MDCAHQGNERAPLVKARMAKVKHKIIVLSGKGGVGKSTVSVNLATALALEGKQVGLLDVDLHGPTVPQLLGLNGAPVAMEGEALAPIPVGENLKVMSIGFLLGERDGAVVWRGPMKAVAIEQFLGEVEWGDLDYLIIDSPPGTGDEPLAVCQAIGKMDGAIIVTTPQETALANVRRSIKFCELLDLRVLGVIENMAGFVCPKCGEVTHIFSKGGGADMAAKAGVPLLASVPLDPAIVEAGDSGKPYIYHYSKSAAAAEFSKAVEPILALETDEVDAATDTDGETAVATPQDVAALEDADSVIRFAVPTSNGLLCPHFGHCQEFTLIDVDRSSKRVLNITILPAPEHEPGLLPAWLADKGAGHIIAGGMGSRAQQLFAQQGVSVITGAPVAEPETVVRQFLDDSLVTGANVCDH
ncbi:MAG: P-loop NTPase [Actinobacteria bacterium]|nr:P-loop NTPase [Actinomycetota bacterium]